MSCGVYGLHVSGIAPAGLGSAPGAGEPRIRILIQRAPLVPRPACVSDHQAVLDLPGGRQLWLRRSAGTAIFAGPALSGDELIHPYLGAAASVFSRWAGREVYHAGAFVAGDLAWAVVGDREAGKSSLLAALAGRRVPVLADDLVITDGRQAFRGPRTIDLRQPLPGSTAPMTAARGGSRWRLALPPLPEEVPLGGWIYLNWRAELSMLPVPASALLARLAARRTWPGLRSDPQTLLALAARPGWDLGRPADWSRLDEVVDLLLTTLAASGRPQGCARISTSPAALHPARKHSTSAVADSGVSPHDLASVPASSPIVVQAPSRPHSNAPETFSAWYLAAARSRTTTSSPA
jgi:hypothetical protein